MMDTYAMTIVGAEVPVSATFPVVNPATGASFANAPDCIWLTTRQAMSSAWIVRSVSLTPFTFPTHQDSVRIAHAKAWGSPETRRPFYVLERYMTCS
jgi:hypothetical protein